MLSVKLFARDSGATIAIGRWLGQRLPAGAFVALTGDLGAGKSTLARGILAGLGIQQQGGSPTFPLLWEYAGGRLPAYHWDVYRIAHPEELEDLGYEEYFYTDTGICIVEWAERVRALWPSAYLHVNLETAADGHEHGRNLALTAAGPAHATLVEELRRADPGF